MKIKAIITIAAFALTTFAIAANHGNGTIKVQVTKASKQLVENWTEAYTTIHPEIAIEIVDKADEANIAVVNDAENKSVTNVARYAPEFSTNPQTKRKTMKMMKRMCCC